MLKVRFSRKFSAFIAAASLAVVGFCVLGYYAQHRGAA